ncbi:hypothetical protein [Streptomyces caniscabiei]|uniref:hypothetical protein n=1 Tax=Streptomyces caniscabiei TaxID=2746961 RepID=UPI00187331AA|nr:hypothetical protein [Streptomyces caniscabiei]MBE4771233.1 hypothetical protein [Streptomyces caniscabiei]MDX2952032.1 hypothetical protein [Streptomyces caniscabiei]
MKLLTLYFPFIFAIGLVAIGPLVTDKIKAFEVSYYEPKFAKLKLDEHVDPETSEESIAEFTQYLIDAYQVIALTIAPVVGVVTAFEEIKLYWWAAIAYLVVALVGFFGFIHMLKDPKTMDPEGYFRGSKWRFWKYSPVAVFGFMVNVAALVVVTCLYFLG